MQNQRFLRRDLLKFSAGFLFAQSLLENDPAYSNESDEDDFKIVTANDYEYKILEENLPNPGRICIDSDLDRIIYCQRSKDGNEETIIKTNNKTYILDPKIRLNNSIYKTLLASNSNGELFIYQSNGIDENLRVLSKNYKVILESKDFTKKSESYTQKIRDISVNPVDQNLYLSYWGDGKIIRLDPKEKKLESKFEVDWKTEFLCFDDKGYCYSTYNNSPGDYSGLELTVSSKDKIKEKILFKNPFEKSGKFRLDLKGICHDNENNNLILTGILEKKDYQRSYVFEANLKTRELNPIAKINSRNILIKGIAADNNKIYFTTCTNPYGICNDGKIIRLTRF